MRIVKESHPELASLFNDWATYGARFMPRKNVPRPQHLRSDSAMIYDGVMILASALNDLDQFQVHEINCDDPRPWQYGASLINYVRQVIKQYMFSQLPVTRKKVVALVQRLLPPHMKSASIFFRVTGS